MGCNLKTSWPRVNTGPVTSPHCWRGQIFELLGFRGGAPPETALSESGRRALTTELLEKYRVFCPPVLLSGVDTGVMPADASSAAACAAGAPFGG